ncbi:hypothetical protein OUZ56_032782 [Daphnia magna]|uniref:Uncharacterized protein n=1 Tax=Daphnia magna TaxID=35525 RepID=A0ABQ9ZXD2_9CRUS|nr:hypothetical protein OUZ56_032782 [Daphnia magna]
MVAPPTLTEVAPAQRPIRNRRPPAGESAWTIVTDLDLVSAGAAIVYLQQKILQQQAVADKWNKQGSRPQKIAAKRIFSKSRSFSKELESVTDKFTTAKESLNTNPRNRRSHIDGGGSALKWLFSVSTQQDLEVLNRHQMQQVKLNEKEMIHIMDKQATVLNEPLANPQLIRNLRDQFASLQGVTAQLLECNKKLEELDFDHFTRFFQLCDPFKALNQILQWLHQLADSLNLGISLLANGHLAPQIVSSARFNAVVKKSADNYLEDVTVAALELHFRIFIQVPIFDHAQQNKLFQIINWPGAADNGTHSVSYSNLPNFLAVAADLETFLELSKDDFRECSKIDRPLCKFHKGISKLNAGKSTPLRRL